MAAKIFIEKLYKTYETGGEALPTLGGVSLSVKNGEFVSLIGPSGCGKSTIFKIICNLTTPDKGSVILDGRPGISPSEIVSYMPQKDLLFPWRTVLENVILAREIQGLNLETAKREARELLPFFGLEGFENSYPAELSGGMRQRAALMRTVLARREILLLDEPFGALDAITRTKMQEWLLKVWSKFKQTILFITHDVDEAIFLSDRVYVLTSRPARICLHLKIDTPRPRLREIVTEKRFLYYKKQVMNALELV